MTRTAKQYAAAFLIIAILGVVTWRLWPDDGRARQRDNDLVHAVKTNDLPDVTRLLEEGADPNALLPAFGLSQKAQIYYLGVTHKIKTPDWGHMDDMNPRWSVLELAVLRGDSDIVSALLSKGADIRYRDKQGKTVVMWGAMLEGMPAMPLGTNRDYPRIAAMVKAAAARPRPAAHP